MKVKGEEFFDFSNCEFESGDIMNFLTISTIILLVLTGTIWGVLGRLSSSSSVAQGSLDELAAPQNNRLQDHVILDDLPPPDDTYTPDQRRYS